eukprot:443630-Pyramimonas_sp.AAC.1
MPWSRSSPMPISDDMFLPGSGGEEEGQWRAPVGRDAIAEAGGFNAADGVEHAGAVRRPPGCGQSD